MTIEPYFLGYLQFTCPPDDDTVMILTAPLLFRDYDGSWKRAKRGLRTDGTSVRRVLDIPVVGWLTRKVLGGDQFTGPFRWASVIHDGGPYFDVAEVTPWAAFRSPGRKRLDAVMRRAARCRKVVVRRENVPVGCSVFDCVERKPASAWRAWAVYWILRGAGWVAWMENGRAALALGRWPW